MNYNQYLQKKGLKQSTVKSYERNFDIFENYIQQRQKKITQASYQDIIDFLQYLSNSNYKVATQRSYLKAVKYYFSMLQEGNKVKSDPSRSIRLRRKVTPTLYTQLPKEYVNCMLEHFPQYNIHWKRNRVLAGLLLFCGLDEGQVARLTVVDVDFGKCTVYISQSQKRNARVLKLHTSLILPLHDYVNNIRPILLNKREDEQLIVGENPSFSITRVIATVLKQIKSQEPQVKSLHHLRSSLFSSWIEEHGLRLAQYMAGHKYVSSTQRYDQTGLKDLQDKVNRFHPLQDNQK